MMMDKIPFPGYSFFCLPHCVSCGILVPPPGMDPGSWGNESLHVNQWTAREVPPLVFLPKIETHI